jgi:hypothetical protein
LSQALLFASRGQAEAISCIPHVLNHPAVGWSQAGSTTIEWITLSHLPQRFVCEADGDVDAQEMPSTSAVLLKEIAVVQCGLDFGDDLLKFVLLIQRMAEIPERNGVQAHVHGSSVESLGACKVSLGEGDRAEAIVALAAAGIIPDPRGEESSVVLPDAHPLK